MSAPVNTTLRHVVYTKGVHFRADGGGRLMGGLGGGHSAGSAPSEAEALAEAELIAERIAQWLPAYRGTDAEAIRVGMRTIWPDGYPVLGRLPHHPSVYITTYHSGVTLAPLLGRLCAEEVGRDVELDELRSYRIDRFSAASDRPAAASA